MPGERTGTRSRRERLVDRRQLDESDMRQVEAAGDTYEGMPTPAAGSTREAKSSIDRISFAWGMSPL